MVPEESLNEKIKEVQQEMKATGIWKLVQPQWVYKYDEAQPATADGFGEWLQFVYLPNLLTEAGHHPALAVRTSIVPQALRFFTNDIQKGRLLQRLIELDSLS